MENWLFVKSNDLIMFTLKSNMIKVLVFDFSGVLYSSRFEKFTKAVLRLVPGLSGNKVIEAFYNKHQDYYAGLIDKNNLWSGAFYLLDIPRTKFTKINKIIFEKGLFTENKYMLKLIKKLSKNYKLAVLSNSAKEMEMVFSTSKYHKYFTGFFWSHKENVRKPDGRFFKLVEKKYKVKPSEILFFDDKEQNTSAAEKIGWKTIKFTKKIYENEAEFLKELEKAGVRVI